ncbi:MAG: glycosyltransferase family 4 protein [Planctomycetota bacterium]|nr:glycosyltransferase family 4 protein [Planctomycetota bacterium]
MGRRYRIVHLITRLDLGGAQQNTLFCVGHHDRRRFDVELIAGRGGLLDDDARALPDAAVHLVPYLKHPIAPWWDVKALFGLWAHFKKREVDLVHTHSSKAGLIGRLAARLAGVPVVVHTAHGWSFNRTQPAHVRRALATLERACAALTDRLVMVSRRNLDQGLALGIGRPGQYAVVRSGIDVAAHRRPAEDRQTTRTALGLEADQILVGTIACFKPQKAPLDFVRAAAAAHARCGRLRFVMAGDGELRGEVAALVRELGLQEIIRPLGWRRDVVELLHAMDVFLLTSRHEGLPRVVLQAMAAGVPVVATDVDGTPEVVRDRRTGLLVPPERPREAADRVLELAGDGPLRQQIAEQAVRELREEFDIHGMVRALERIYIFLLEERDLG